MMLHELKPARGAHKRPKILGRGRSSGHGKTSTRGQTGQNQHANKPRPAGFEGGQMPLFRRLPKRGFTSRKRKNRIFQIVNLQDLKRFKENTVVDLEILAEKGLIKSKDIPVKLLGNGEITKPLTIKVNKSSKSAQEKIKKAGGKLEVIHA